MKTLILIFTLAVFNISFAITENIADCGPGNSDVASIEVSADATSSSPASISIEQ